VVIADVQPPNAVDIPAPTAPTADVIHILMLSIVITPQIRI
jgi:hypothetical protein